MLSALNSLNWLKVHKTLPILFEHGDTLGLTEEHNEQIVQSLHDRVLDADESSLMSAVSFFAAFSWSDLLIHSVVKKEWKELFSILINKYPTSYLLLCLVFYFILKRFCH
jgi:hypothetical protein